MPRHNGNIPQRSPVERSWYCSHLTFVSALQSCACSSLVPATSLATDHLSSYQNKRLPIAVNEIKHWQR
eukprot:201739-Amphidinium_carterae.1